MAVRIGQASLGESGAHNQKAGNQTGRELNFSYWYKGSWLFVLRFKDRKKAKKAVKACKDAVNNPNIGYDQDQRNTMRNQAKALNWDFSAITQPCETDCSALMCACTEAADVNLAPQYYSGNACTTYTMGTAFPATGEFIKLMDSKYTKSDKYLLEGDILVNSGHTVMVLENGSNWEEEFEMVERSKIIVNGKEIPVERILKDGTNYVKVRDLAAALNLEVGFKGNIATLTSKEDK